ncbi:MAG: hypothetical protein SPJ13_01900 [Bacteroidales bacterium]|nr:hypothetical protein [Bacteroidales bacterium]
MKKFFQENKGNPWFWTFLAVAATLLLAMPILSHGAGNSGDEDGFQIPQGENVLNYYATNGQDTSCMTFENLKYYGCSFDVVMAKWNQVFHVDDIARTRHAANALCGWIVVLFVGLIAWRIGGWRAGVIAMALMFLSPRFLGHSFNNPKDIPFAAGITMAIYYIMMFFRQAPKPKWSTMLMLAFSLAFAISIRVGGLIIIGYFGLWGIAWMFLRENTKGAKVPCFEGLGATLLRAAAICVVGFFAGLLLWPYAWQSPINHSLESFRAMSQFAIGIRQIYEGQMVWSDALPWYYTPKFLLTTIPVAVIIGWLLSHFTGAWKKENRMESTMLYFVFLFPVIWIAYTKANVYGGWRHSLFAYPPMVAMAGLGFDGLAKIFEKANAPKWHRWAGMGATLLPFLMLIGPAAHIARNHPYEYVYWNKLGGGTKAAFGRYEMDYYYHSMREATEWVINNAEKTANGKKAVVGTWHINSTRYFLRNDTTHFQPRFIRWYSRGDYDWDYAVFPVTGIDPAYLLSDKVFPPKNTVYQVKVDGVPIAVVLKRMDWNDFYGSELKKKGLVDTALVCFHRALKVNPYNESVLLNMAEIFLQKNQPDSTLWAASRFFEFEPDNDNMNYFAAYAYLQKGDFNKMIELCDNIKKHNFKYAMAYQLPATAHAQMGNLDDAENELMRAMDADQMNDMLMQLYVQIKQAQGLNQQQAVVSLYNAMRKSYEKRGKKREAEMYRKMLP